MTAELSGGLLELEETAEFTGGFDTADELLSGFDTTDETAELDELDDTGALDDIPELLSTGIFSDEDGEIEAVPGSLELSEELASLDELDELDDISDLVSDDVLELCVLSAGELSSKLEVSSVWLCVTLDGLYCGSDSFSVISAHPQSKARDKISAANLCFLIFSPLIQFAVDAAN